MQTGFDLGTVAAAFVGKDLKLVHPDIRPGCHPFQLAAIVNLIGDIVIDDQVILSIYADLDIEPHLGSTVLTQRHGSAIGIHEGNPGFV